MRVDFRKIKVKDLSGNIEYIDISKVFGNFVFNNTTDIEEYDLSKKIYYDGEVDITEKQSKSLVRYADAFERVIIREALKQTLFNGIKETEL